MSRSRVLVASLAALLLALGARSAPAQEGTLLDAIGTLDYARGPSIIKPGSWVKYHMTARSELGVTDDYTVTVLIAGEEEWWGEDCFWVETWTQRGTHPVEIAATLMSFGIFDDSLAVPHILVYQRKRISEVDENGNPREQTMRRGDAAIKSRTPPDRGLTRRVEVLGTDSLKTPLGDLFCTKVRTEQGVSSTGQSADSSQYTEIRDVRVSWMSPQVPVTGNAREELDYSIARRTWLTGRSQESSLMRTMDRSKGLLELVGFGTGGLEAKYVPKEFRRSLAEQRAAAAAPKAAAPRGPAPKPRTTPSKAKTGTR
jgi:hypothetical protein